MRTLARTLLATMLVFGVAMPSAYAVEKKTTTKQVSKSAKAKAVKGGNTTAGGIATGGGVMELSSWDCKNVGGTVITVTDGRCGASGQYCRMPDTNAVCIDTLR